MYKWFFEGQNFCGFLHHNHLKELTRLQYGKRCPKIDVSIRSFQAVPFNDIHCGPSNIAMPISLMSGPVGGRNWSKCAHVMWLPCKLIKIHGLPSEPPFSYSKHIRQCTHLNLVACTL